MATTLTPSAKAALIDAALTVLPSVGNAAGRCNLHAIWHPALASSVGVFRLVLEQIVDPHDSLQSFVVKVVDESHRGRREAGLYASGVLSTLQSPLVSARCFGVVPVAGGNHVIVMEDLHDRFGGKWPDSQFLGIARAMGRFGANPPTMVAAAAGAVPVRDFLANHDVYANAMDFLVMHSEDPAVLRLFSPITSRSLMSLATTHRRTFIRDRADVMLACHGDAHRRNFVALTHSRFGVLDWPNLATAPPGLDVATSFTMPAVGSIEGSMTFVCLVKR